MKFPWFKRSGIFYVPRSLPGWILLAVALVCAVLEFRVIDNRSHSASDTLINWVFRLLIIGSVYTLAGWLTSIAPRKRS
jgi:hypothetical protein